MQAAATMALVIETASRSGSSVLERESWPFRAGRVQKREHLLSPKEDPKMAQGIVTLTDETFGKDVLKSDTPVLVDFWAEWCAPCRALTPIIEHVAKNYEGKLTVGKLNIDEQPTTPGKYDVQAIPTVLLFKNGEVVDKLIGLANKAKFEEMLAKHVG
jgi:thioredoxin 1